MPYQILDLGLNFYIMKNADLVFYLKNGQIFIWKNTDQIFLFIKNRPDFYK